MLTNIDMYVCIFSRSSGTFYSKYADIFAYVYVSIHYRLYVWYAWIFYIRQWLFEITIKSKVFLNLK